MCCPSVPSQLKSPNQSAQCESKDGRFVPIMFQDYNGHYSFEQLFKGTFYTMTSCLLTYNSERTSTVIGVLSLVAICVCVILISACYIYRNPSSNNNKRLKSNRLRKNKQLHKYLIRNNINTGSPTLVSLGNFSFKNGSNAWFKGFSGGYVRSASFSMLSNDDFKTIDDRVLFNDDDNEPQPCSVSSQQSLQEKAEPKKKVKPEKPIRTSSLNKFKNI